MNKLLAAIAYLTGIPVRNQASHSSENLRRASGFFPIVGLLIGFFLAGVYFITVQITNATVATLFTLGAEALITLCVHLDGYAGTCDALGGTKSRDQALSRMKDAHRGVFGITALFFLLALKTAALLALNGPRLIGFLIITPAIARWTILGSIHSTPAAPQSSQLLAITRGEYALATFFIIALALIVYPSTSLPALLVTLGVTYLLSEKILKKIGEANHLTYGFLIECAALLFLISAVIFG